MSIDYGLFQFAAPPRTGVSWVTEACRSAGLFSLSMPRSAQVRAAWTPFPKRTDDSPLRVSLVRHPCYWLRSVYDSLANVPHSKLVPLGFVHPVPVLTFRKDSFAAFVRDHLAKASGTIGQLFDSYKCDARMRLEDMPWAMTELLESLGVPKAMQDRVVELERRNTTVRASRWEPYLFDQVMESESQFCADLDYY